jgi:hypothetical protein
MDLSAEILIYIQKVKSYFSNNAEATQYFIGDSDVDFFYNRMTELSKQNFEKFGNPTLSKEQFESLRQVVFTVEVNKDDLPKSNDDNIFIDMRGYHKICLN